MELAETIADRSEALFSWLKSSLSLSSHPYPERLSPALSESLAEYLRLLVLWTERIDLVAPASEDEHIERHLLDSLAAGYVLQAPSPLPYSSTYLDVGSGAGLPGIVIGLMEPELSVMLCVPREKRVVFMREAISKLKLENVAVVCARAEELNSSHVSSLGVVLSRALGNTELLIQTAARLGAEGCLVAELLGPTWDGPNAYPGAELKDLIPYSLSSKGASRQIGFWNVSRETS